MLNTKQIRAYIAEELEVDPTEIVLADSPLPPDWKGAYTKNAIGVNYTYTGVSRVIAIDFDSVKSMDGCIEEIDFTTDEVTPGVPLHKIASGNEAFFAVLSINNINCVETSCWTLYKSPDFEKYWNEQDEKNLLEWESWLKDDQSKNPEKNIERNYGRNNR